MITVFFYRNIKVRVVSMDDDIYFHADDIAKALGYVDYKQAAETLCENAITTMCNKKLIGEDGVFILIVGSNVRLSKPFHDWFYMRCIPNIRQLDSYSIVNPIARAKRWIKEQEELMCTSVNIDNNE